MQEPAHPSITGTEIATGTVVRRVREYQHLSTLEVPREVMDIQEHSWIIRQSRIQGLMLTQSKMEEVYNDMERAILEYEQYERECEQEAEKKLRITEIHWKK